MNNLSKFISVAHRRTQIFYKENLEKLELKSGQFIYIVCICETPGQTQDELSNKLIIDKSTVTKFLGQLEAEGYITKKINSFDRRAFNVFPTEKAIKIYPKIIEIQDKWHNFLLEGFSKIESDVFEKLMELVMENSITNSK
ncbi:MarR family winged helix-turn-helix transcriptional regulator [Clostridium sp. YIM B02555]|uniref:MarR family winged helix-turn-helix transcriptional regulator n=1 Tax=Clostridium sp. YIM B02555 TaxID=2911968 RepID=UPI001EEE67E5|nr:MarR family winged helix-turn-helix transcriptional regulator [Clostridium sp. YIM B02555]